MVSIQEYRIMVRCNNCGWDNPRGLNRCENCNAPLTYDVFISYSRKDYVDDEGNVLPNNMLSKIKDTLNANGISYWFDENGIYSGDEFASIITRAIRNSKVFLFISSANSNSDDALGIFCEIEYAVNMRMKIIPLLLDNTAFNDSICLLFSNRDKIEFYKNPNKGLDDLTERIKKHIKEIEIEVVERECCKRETEEARIQRERAFERMCREEEDIIRNIKEQKEVQRLKNEHQASNTITEIVSSYDDEDISDILLGTGDLLIDDIFDSPVIADINSESAFDVKSLDECDNEHLEYQDDAIELSRLNCDWMEDSLSDIKKLDSFSNDEDYNNCVQTLKEETGDNSTNDVILGGLESTCPQCGYPLYNNHYKYCPNCGFNIHSSYVNTISASKRNFPDSCYNYVPAPLFCSYCGCPTFDAACPNCGHVYDFDYWVDAKEIELGMDINRKDSIKCNNKSQSTGLINAYSSIFAPAEVKRRSHMLIQVYVHLFEEAETVKTLAQESQKNTERRDIIQLECSLRKGDEIVVLLNIYGEKLLMSERKTVVWQGHFTKCSFGYFVPMDIDVDELSCMALLSVNGIPVGEMRFITEIVEVPRKLNSEIIAHKYKKVFISYAHKDEAKVKSFHEGLKLAGIEHFFDRAYLKSGDVFPQVIQDYINSADLFVLFWSENASKSEYVNKERKQALERAFPQVKPQQEAKLSIYPMSIEPRAELPGDMKDNYHFGEL